MYFTSETIHMLDKIIFQLNHIKEEEERKNFLNKYIEDPSYFLHVIQKIEKDKILKEEIEPHSIVSSQNKAVRKLSPIRKEKAITVSKKNVISRSMKGRTLDTYLECNSFEEKE